MTKSSVRMRQVVDVSAAIWAGLIAGVVFLVFQMIMVATIYNDSIFLVFRWAAAIVLGTGVLPPEASGFSFGIFIMGLLLHLGLSVLYSLLIAFIIHRWGLVVGIVGGAFIGLALFMVNYYTMTILFPWFYVASRPAMMLGHMLFGAIAGGIYEGLEVEEFVPVES